MQLPKPEIVGGEESIPKYPGREHHICFTINNIDLIKDRLEKAGYSYHLSSSGRRALFCRDPDLNGFEFMEDTSM